MKSEYLLKSTKSPGILVWFPDSSIIEDKGGSTDIRSNTPYSECSDGSFVRY